MNTLISKARKLFEDFSDKQYRDAYVENHINDGLAFQIRTMRKNDNLSQKDLAGSLGTQQTAISRLENPDYGQFNLGTLKKLASIFDVALMVRFVPFSELANRTAHLSHADINVSPYNQDHGLQEYADCVGGKTVSTFYDLVNLDAIDNKTVSVSETTQSVCENG